ncbi:MAG: citramalate synthase [Bryobacterales bacterium]|nr:citramalate synthase [Bryobacterales bacterium]
MTTSPKTRIYVLDTTLRDGTQGEAVSFSVEDKLAIAEKLDQLGIDYIEGGWPGSNPKDKEFFERARHLNLKHAKLAAFGSTRFAKHTVETDPNVRCLLEAQTPAVCVFGKTWDLHTRKALGVTEAENQVLIRETVGVLKRDGREVIFDAEHFFDGYKGNRDFALRALAAAAEAGADVLCLCDTNGGSMPNELAEIVSDVRSHFGGLIGIHTHDDSGVGVANSLTAVREGATHVQGCLNGYGERCGNANLASVIANLELKMGYEVLGSERLQNLTGVARFIADLANLPLPNGLPYVGQSAFAHKGGVHVAAVLKDAATYEHVSPETVGNRQRVLLSDLSGRGNIFYKLKEHGLEERLSDESRRVLLEQIKQLEYEGYELEAAEGTFELLVREALYPELKFFEVVNIETTTRMSDSLSPLTTATVTLKVNGGTHSHTGIGHGPVNALDECLRSCLSQHYPEIKRVALTDYKVRVLDNKKGTAAKVRVLVEWTDHEKSWATVGVSENVIEASWRALADAIRLELMRLHDSGGAAVAEPTAAAGY